MYIKLFGSDTCINSTFWCKSYSKSAKGAKLHGTL